MSGIVVVGAGAIGGVAAGRAIERGHDVVACVRQGFRELQWDSPEGSRRLALGVVTDPRNVEPAAWVLLATKAHQVEGAGAWLSALVAQHTRVAVLQNGVEHAERVARWVPPERVVAVVVSCPAERVAPGHVVQRGPARFTVADDAKGRSFAELVGAVVTADFGRAAWEKLCLNVVSGALAALAGKPLPQIAHPQKLDLARGLARECARVARAEGVALSDDAATEIAERTVNVTRGGEPSIYRDRMRGEPLEWDARNGVIARLGARHGIPTPLSDKASALLASAHLERSRDLLPSLSESLLD